MSKKLTTVTNKEVNKIKNEYSVDQFFDLIRNGCVDAIKIYIDLRLVDAATIKDEDGKTPRMVAINASQPEVIKYLDSVLGHPNIGNDINMTTLFGAEANHNDTAG